MGLLGVGLLWVMVAGVQAAGGTLLRMSEALVCPSVWPQRRPPPLQLYKIGQYGFLLNLYSVDTEHALAALDLIHILRRRITAELSFNY